jgi:hypothetical protein
VQSIRVAQFTMPTEEAEEGDVHLPEGWLEDWEAKEAKVAKKDGPQLLTAAMPMEVSRQGTTPVVTRAQWGARNPRSSYSKITPSTGGVALHWEGPQMGTFSHDSCASKMRGIQAYHMDHNGWMDVAYSACACPHGYLFIGRWLHNRSAANGTADGNDRFYAICGLFGQNDPFTDDCKGAYLDGISVLRSQGGAGTAVRPHSSFKATACPGDGVRGWITAGLPAPAGYLDPPAPPPPESTPALPTRVSNVVGLIEDPSSNGGWMVTTEGHIYTLAPANFYGSLGGVPLRAPISGGVATPTGRGYWLFGKDGGVFAFGDAPFRGTYGALADEYARGERAVIGGSFRGDQNDPGSWCYTLVTDKLEAYAI